MADFEYESRMAKRRRMEFPTEEMINKTIAAHTTTLRELEKEVEALQEQIKAADEKVNAALEVYNKADSNLGAARRDLEMARNRLDKNRKDRTHYSVEIGRASKTLADLKNKKYIPAEPETLQENQRRVLRDLRPFPQGEFHRVVGAA